MDSVAKTEQIEISAINRNLSNQMRVDHVRADVVTEYAEAMADGAVFPPVKVYMNEEGRYHLSDGFHRVAAAEKNGSTTIAAIIEPGNERQAWLNSLGVNDTHGLRRSASDKRNAIEQALGDSELRQWSDNAIAKVCNVSPHTVKSVRMTMHLQSDTMQMQSDSPRTYTDRWGNTATMDTSNIGRKSDVRQDVQIDADLSTALKRLVVKHGADEVRRAADAILAEMAEW